MKTYYTVAKSARNLPMNFMGALMTQSIFLFMVSLYALGWAEEPIDVPLMVLWTGVITLVSIGVISWAFCRVTPRPDEADRAWIRATYFSLAGFTGIAAIVVGRHGEVPLILIFMGFGGIFIYLANSSPNVREMRFGARLGYLTLQLILQYFLLVIGGAIVSYFVGQSVFPRD